MIVACIIFLIVGLILGLIGGISLGWDACLQWSSEQISKLSGRISENLKEIKGGE